MAQIHEAPIGQKARFVQVAVCATYRMRTSASASAQVSEAALRHTVFLFRRSLMSTLAARRIDLGLDILELLRI